MSFLAPVGEIVVSRTDVVVCALLGEAKNCSLEGGRSVVQKLLEGSLGLNGFSGTVCGSHTVVVAGAGESCGEILSGERGWIAVKRGPDNFCVSKESGILPRDRVIGVGVSSLDDVLTIGTSSTFTCISRLTVTSRVTIVVRVGTCGLREV